MSARWPAPARRALAAALRSLGMLLAVALAVLAGWLDRVSPPSGCHHQMVPADVPAPSPLAAVSEAMDVPDAPVPAPPPRAAQEAMAVTPPDGMAVLPRADAPPGPGQHPRRDWPPHGTVHGAMYGTFRHDGLTGYPRTDALVAVDDATCAVTVIPATMLARPADPEPLPPERELARPWMALGPGGHCVAVSPAEFMRERDGRVMA